VRTSDRNAAAVAGVLDDAHELAEKLRGLLDDATGLASESHISAANELTELTDVVDDVASRIDARRTELRRAS
jgi:hypothetical protein